MRSFPFALALLASACTAAGGGNAPGCNAGEARGTSEAGLEQVELCVTSGTKQRAFTVEIAATGAQQTKGLMFRSALADDKGMVFPFREPRFASFWMKNTQIPLDIIFVRADGKIENIAENAIPFSLEPEESTAVVAAVLELRGGLTSELGIAPGDSVRWH